MSKDYAKRVFTTTHKPKKKRKGLIYLNVLVIAFIIGLGAYWIYFQKNTLLNTNESFLTKFKTWIVHKKSIDLPMQRKYPDLTAEKTTNPEIHFDFYTELPKMQVTVQEEQANVATSPNQENTVHGQTYLLQFGKFTDEMEASRVRLSLLLAGCDAVMVKSDSSQGAVYHLQSGPFLNLAEAKKLKTKLELKGFTSILQKI